MRNIGRSSPIKATHNIALVTDTAMGVGVERTTIFTSEEAQISKLWKNLQVLKLIRVNLDKGQS